MRKTYFHSKAALELNCFCTPSVVLVKSHGTKGLLDQKSTDYGLRAESEPLSASVGRWPPPFVYLLSMAALGLYAELTMIEAPWLQSLKYVPSGFFMENIS